MPEEVYVELSTEVIERLKLQRPRPNDAGVVDDPGHARVADRLRHGGAGRVDERWLGDVDEHRRERLRRTRLQRLAVDLLPDAFEDREFLLGETQGTRVADARRGPGDDDGAAVI